MFNIFNLDALVTKERVVAVAKCARFALNCKYEVSFFQDVLGRCRKYHLGAGDDTIDDRYWIVATDALCGMMIGFASGTLGDEHDASVDMVCLLAGMDATDAPLMLMRGFERAQVGTGVTMCIYRAGANLEVYRTLARDGYMPFDWRKSEPGLENSVSDAVAKACQDPNSTLGWLSDLIEEMWQDAMKPETTMQALRAKYTMLMDHGKVNPMWILVKPVTDPAL